MQDRRNPGARDAGSRARTAGLPVALPALAILVLIVILALVAWFGSSRAPKREQGSQESGGTAAGEVE